MLALARSLHLGEHVELGGLKGLEEGAHHQGLEGGAIEVRARRLAEGLGYSP